MRTSQSRPPSTLIDGTPYVESPLSARFKKSQCLLRHTIENLFERHRLQCVLIIALTFASEIRSTKEAQRRLNSLLNPVRRRYPLGYLWVLQPQISGRIHFHLLVPTSSNLWEGSCIAIWESEVKHSFEDKVSAMGPALLAEHQWWQEKAASHGFGRTEVAPVYSNGKAVACYLSKQDWRHGHWPFEEKKAFQFWRCSRNLSCGNLNFSWLTPNGTKLRKAKEAWAREEGCANEDELKKKFGKHWGFYFLLYFNLCEAREASGE